MAQLGTDARVETRADAVLAALDDEQRAAAQAVSGPVCILAGAGTGKTRTITHRIAYGVHTGVYVPEQVLAVTFTARAAGEMRGRLAGLDVGGVQARTFHAAALRQLRYFAPRVLGGADARAGREQAPAGGRGRVPVAAVAPTGPACATWPARSSGPRRPWSTPDDYPVARPRRPAASRRSRPPRSPRSTPRYESAKRATGCSTSRTCCWSPSRPSRSTPTSPSRSAASTGTSSSTSTRTSTRCSSGCSTPGWAGGPTSASSATPTRRSTRSPAPTPTYLLGFADRYPRRRRRPAGARLPLHPAGGRAGEPADRAGAAARGAAGCELHRPARRRARAGGSPSTPTSRPRRPPSRRAARELIDGGHAGRGDRGAVPDQRAVRRSYESALADAGVPYVLQGGERFFERPEVREARAAAARRGRRRQRAGALVPTVRDVLGAPRGWVEHRPPPGRRGPRPVGVAGRAGRPGRRPRRREPDARPAGFVDAPGRAGRRPARADGAGRHAGVAARRQGPGVGRRLRGRAGRRRAADRVSPSPAPAVEEERRLLYVGDHPGPRAARALSWSLAPRTPVAEAAPVRAAGSSPVLRRPTPGPRRRRRAVPAKRPKVRRSRGEAGGAVRAAPGLAAARRRSRRRVPAYVVFTDATLQAHRRDPAGHAARAVGARRASVPRKLELYGDDVLADGHRLTANGDGGRFRNVQRPVRRTRRLIRLTLGDGGPSCPVAHELNPVRSRPPGRIRTERRGPMTSTPWTAAPAGLLGLGCFAVRRVTAASSASALSTGLRHGRHRRSRCVASVRSPRTSCPSSGSRRIAAHLPRSERRHHPRDPLLEETTELTARPVLLEAAEPEPRDPRPFSLLCGTRPRPPVGGTPPAVAEPRRGGAAVLQTIDRRRPTADPGSPRPALRSGTPDDRDGGPARTGPASPALPGGGPRPVVRREPRPSWSWPRASARTAR